jgi:hypothetical protein
VHDLKVLEANENELEVVWRKMAAPVPVVDSPMYEICETTTFSGLTWWLPIL